MGFLCGSNVRFKYSVGKVVVLKGVFVWVVYVHSAKSSLSVPCGECGSRNSV